MGKIIRIGPQKGPQERFLATSADICIYGGAAGGGKTFGLLLEPIRHMNNKNVQCGYLPKQLHTGHISWWFVG